MNKTPRVLAAGCYGVANVGDELLLLTLRQWVHELGGELSVLSLDPEYTSSVMDLPAVSFFDVSEIAQAMQRTDLLVMGGGGIFQDHYRFDISALYDPDAYEISSYARPFYIAKQFGVPTLILAHGVGPLGGTGAKDMTRDIFSTADFVSVRDKDSAEILSTDLGIKRPVFVAPDPSWCLISSPGFFNRRIDLGLPSGKKRLGLIVRSWSIDKGWEKKLIDALREVLTPEWECTWIGFQTVRDQKISVSDRPFLEQLSAQLDGAVSSTVVDKLLPEEAGAIISQCDAVLAMRLHGAILSLAAGVPTLSYEYDKKMGLAMELASMPTHLRVQLSDSSNQLAEALRHIMGQTGVAWRLPESELRSMASSALVHRKVLAEAMENARSRKMPVHWEAGQYDWLRSWRFSDSYKARARDVTVAERAAQIASLNQSVAGRDAQIASLNQSVAERDAQIASLNQSVAERDAQIANLGNELGSLMSMCQAIRNSRSWRFMAPLRFIARLARHGLLVEDRRWFERKLRSIFRKLPLSISAKMAMRGWYARLFGRPLPDSDSQRAFLGLPGVGTPSLSQVDLSGNDSGDFLAPESWDHHKMPYGVVVLPIIDWNFRFQRPQQIARRFAMKGHPVAYASLSFGPELGIAPIEEGIEELRLPGPGSKNVYKEMPSEAEIKQLSGALLRYVSNRAPHSPWVCIVQLPYWGPIAERLNAQAGYPIVYDCMDDHAGFTTNGEQMLAAEERLLGQADLVVASSDLLFHKVQPLAKRTALIRNAVDYAHFAAVPALSHSPISSLTVGYYGAIADWFDSALVAEVARLRPSWQLVLIGSTFSADTGPLTACPGISILGEQPYTELPKLIADWDCCIIPFKRLPLTEATNPVKVYEMLAAGKPVVSVGLPELMPIADAGYIALADTAAEFVTQIENQVTQDAAQRQEARRNYASENTWEVRQEALDQAISQVYPLVSIVVVTYNNLALNRLCLESLFNDTDYPNFEIIVVDNASSDETPAYLKSLQWENCTVILNDENRGFSAANNQGLAKARGEYLCLLNNDTVVAGSWLSTLVRHLQANPDIGLIGPVTNAISNEAKIPVGYRNLQDMPAWSARYCQSKIGSLDDIPMLAFFCVVMPRPVFESVGLLDDRFGIGMFEDDDYNRRVREAGYKVKLARDAYIHHWQRASFKLLGEDTYFETFNENEIKYRSKWAADALDKKHAEKLAGLLTASKASARTIIFAPSIGWSVHLFQRPHHLAHVLARDGYTVVFDCSNGHDQIAFLKEVEPRLFLFKGEAELLAGLHQPVLWTFTYNYGYRARFPRDIPVVYDWIDDLSVFPYDQKLLAQLHSRAMKEATVVASVARRLHETALVDRTDAVYLPNAVEEGRFDHPPTPNPALDDKEFARIVSSGKHIAGYYGALAHWFDYELLSQTAGLRPDWHFVLIGTDHDGSLEQSDLRNHRNITWLGPRDYQALPGYLHLFDVAMIPFKINDITLATSPLKLFEYFAGGKPVVSTPMPECAAFSEVFIAGNADEFSATLDVARDSATDPEYLSQLAALVKENTWGARVRKVMEALIDAGDHDGGSKENKQDSMQLSNRPIPKVFRDWEHVAGYCNVCGQPARFFYQDKALYREQLSCEHCRSTSRYRSIARGLLQAIKETAGVDVAAISQLPHTGVSRNIRIYDTQPPFRYEPCAYSIPVYLRQCDWIAVSLSAYKPDLPLGSDLADGVTNQNLERLTYPDAHFDIVVTSDVMEHVRLDALAHAEIARVLRPDGIYLFTVPHRWEWDKNQIRVKINDPGRQEADEHLLEPEYHGDANSGDGSGVLAYRAYGKELKDQLAAVGLSLRYEKSDFPQYGILNTELFYCRTQPAESVRPRVIRTAGVHKTGTAQFKTIDETAKRQE
jgi:polysaccharide pyruvyl transferase CsaB